jgi:hypothetical protein
MDNFAVMIHATGKMTRCGKTSFHYSDSELSLAGKRQVNSVIDGIAQTTELPAVILSSTRGDAVATGRFFREISADGFDVVPIGIRTRELRGYHPDMDVAETCPELCALSQIERMMNQVGYTIAITHKPVLLRIFEHAGRCVTVESLEGLSLHGFCFLFERTKGKALTDPDGFKYVRHFVP